MLVPEGLRLGNCLLLRLHSRAEWGGAPTRTEEQAAAPRHRMDPWILILGVLIHSVQGQGDFDLADALDDPDPTKKPSSGIYPKPPYQPQPGNPSSGGNIYPRPKPPAPRPHPGSYDSGGNFNDRDDHGGRYPPRPRPPAGGGGYNPNYDGYGNTYGGGSHSNYGNPQGNVIARIVSPIVSVLVVTLVGAATTYFTRNRRRNCFNSNVPENV
ncbi:glycoprotein Xg-like [Rhynchocyon petersi]